MRKRSRCASACGTSTCRSRATSALAVAGGRWCSAERLTARSSWSAATTQRATRPRRTSRRPAARGDRDAATRQKPINVDPSQVTVAVLNGTTVQGLAAAKVGEEVELGGLHARHDRERRRDRPDRSRRCSIGKGQAAAARAVANRLGIKATAAGRLGERGDRRFLRRRRAGWLRPRRMSKRAAGLHADPPARRIHRERPGSPPFHLARCARVRGAGGGHGGRVLRHDSAQAGRARDRATHLQPALLAKRRRPARFRRVRIPAAAYRRRDRLDRDARRGPDADAGREPAAVEGPTSSLPLGRAH